jgi:hypothetical protein
MYWAARFGYMWSTNQILGHGPVRQITYSAATASPPDSRTTVRLETIIPLLSVSSVQTAVVYEVRFEIIISDTLEGLASSYLFLCPTHHLQIAHSSFRWPDYPVYWSMDCLGSERLTAEEATQYGFPSIQLITGVHGDFWDGCVYMGLRQFHHGKGFDPDSSEVARHLGFPLYQISGEAEAAFSGKFRL